MLSPANYRTSIEPPRILTALLITITCCMALMLATIPADAMDTLTQEELGTIAGQAGITIAAGSTMEGEITFSALRISDPNTTGWLVIDGGGTPNTATITNTIGQGEKLVLHFATTGNTTFTDNNVDIPADTTYVAGSMPAVYPTIDLPQNMTMGLAGSSGTIAKTLGVVRFTSPTAEAVAIERGYIWANP